MATCDPQLFNEILTTLLNELQRKPSSAVSGKKPSLAEMNTNSKNNVGQEPSDPTMGQFPSS